MIDWPSIAREFIILFVVIDPVGTLPVFLYVTQDVPRRLHARLAIRAVAVAAAVLLGGTSFLGGVGGVTGTAVGVLFIGTLQNGLSISGVSSFWQQVVTGVILIVAVAIDRLQQNRGIRFRRVRGATGEGPTSSAEPMAESE